MTARAGSGDRSLTAASAGGEVVTEAEWLTCTDPTPMLELLRGRMTERKLRLFGVACCRRIQHLLTDTYSEKILVLAERVAEGQQSLGERPPYFEGSIEDVAVSSTLLGDALRAAASAADLASDAVGFATAKDEAFSDYAPAILAERRSQADLLRCLFGDPFRNLSLTVVAPWLAWGDSLIRKLAQTIYDERAFDRLPILADALEDAGCDNADLLAHCRGPGPHVRGCWVVDLLLGKS